MNKRERMYSKNQQKKNNKKDLTLLISIAVSILIIIVAYLLIDNYNFNSFQPVTAGNIERGGRDSSNGEEYLTDLRDNSYIRLRLNIAFDDEIGDESLQEHPIVRDAVISVLRDKTNSELTNGYGMEDLKKEIINELDNDIRSNRELRVYITDFITY